MKPISSRTTSTNQELIQQSPFETTNAAELQSKGFRLKQSNPHASICLGNNWALPGRPPEESSRVLDGASIAPVVDSDGVIIGYVQATADGYGHPPDELTCTRIAESSNLTTKYCAESIAKAFSQEPNRAIQHMPADIKAATEKAYRELHSQQNIEECSLLVSVVLNRGIRSSYHVGVGDLSAFFINPITLEIENALKATAYTIHNAGDKGDSFAPETAQHVFAEPGDHSTHLQENSLCPAHPNAYLVHVSDGVTDYLDTTERKKEGTLVTRISLRKLTSALQNQLNYAESNETPYSKVEITKALNEIVTEKLIAKRQAKLADKPAFEKALALLNRIDTNNTDNDRPQRHKYKLTEFSKVFDDICDAIKADDASDDNAISIARFCMKELLAMDGAENRTFKSLLSFIATEKYPKPSGDDTTITMTNIIDHKVELVRAWMEHPDKRDNLLRRMSKFTLQDIEHAFKLLAKETVITNDDAAYNNTEEKLYSKKRLQKNAPLLMLSLDLQPNAQQTLPLNTAIRVFIAQTEKAPSEKEKNEAQSQLIALAKHPEAQSKAFLEYAKTLSGSPVVWKNAVGGSAMAVGLGFAIAAAFTACDAVNYGPLAPLTLGLAIAALVCLGVGIGFLVNGRRENGLSKQASHLGKQFSALYSKETVDTDLSSSAGPEKNGGGQ